ncbi:hypothetical protein [Thalassiella azotivora]
MAGSGVEVSWAALERAANRGHGEQLWVRFRTPGGDGAADLEAAVGAANDARPGTDEEDDVFGEGVSTCDDGAVVLVSRLGSPDGLRGWLGDVARTLEDRGREGALLPAPEARLPDWLAADPGLGPQLGAFVAYSVDRVAADDEAARGAWLVAPDVTQEITRSGARWGAFEGSRTFLTVNAFTVELVEQDVSDGLRAGVERFGLAEVAHLRASPRRLSTTGLAPHGLRVSVLWDDELGWAERVAVLREQVVTLPGATDLAFVRHTGPVSPSWGSFASGGPRPPGIRPGQAESARHLHHEYVPDAHGIQVLTDAHLARARDLSSWQVTSLAGGRHLVEAADLAPWFAGDDVDPEVLAAARDDFGDMVLTKEVVKANPPAWKRR